MPESFFKMEDVVKQLTFEEGKVYVVLCDPCYINIEAIPNMPQWEKDIKCIFIPCWDVTKVNSLCFESVHELQLWVKELKKCS